MKVVFDSASFQIIEGSSGNWYRKEKLDGFTQHCAGYFDGSRFVMNPNVEKDINGNLEEENLEEN